MYAQIVLFDGFDPLDVIAPYEVLWAGGVASGGALTVELVSAEGPREVAGGSGGLVLRATATLDPSIGARHFFSSNTLLHFCPAVDAFKVCVKGGAMTVSPILRLLLYSSSRNSSMQTLLILMNRVLHVNCSGVNFGYAATSIVIM